MFNLWKFGPGVTFPVELRQVCDDDSFLASPPRFVRSSPPVHSPSPASTDSETNSTTESALLDKPDAIITHLDDLPDSGYFPANSDLEASKPPPTHILREPRRIRYVDVSRLRDGEDRIVRVLEQRLMQCRNNHHRLALLRRLVRTKQNKVEAPRMSCRGAAGLIRTFQYQRPVTAIGFDHAVEAVVCLLPLLIDPPNIVRALLPRSGLSPLQCSRVCVRLGLAEEPFPRNVASRSPAEEHREVASFLQSRLENITNTQRLLAIERGVLCRHIQQPQILTITIPKGVKIGARLETSSTPLTLVETMHSSPLHQVPPGSRLLTFNTRPASRWTIEDFKQHLLATENQEHRTVQWWVPRPSFSLPDNVVLVGELQTFAACDGAVVHGRTGLAALCYGSRLVQMFPCDGGEVATMEWQLTYASDCLSHPTGPCAGFKCVPLSDHEAKPFCGVLSFHPCIGRCAACSGGSEEESALMTACSQQWVKSILIWTRLPAPQRAFDHRYGVSIKLHSRPSIDEECESTDSCVDRLTLTPDLEVVDVGGAWEANGVRIGDVLVDISPVSRLQSALWSRVSTSQHCPLTREEVVDLIVGAKQVEAWFVRPRGWREDGVEGARSEASESEEVVERWDTRRGDIWLAKILSQLKGHSKVIFQ
eukprot:c5132_g1_i1.p1 GENE.c5132_g1_i1~~c5132_g1_i1.p1  ORF type:complete len:720 (+),score=108.60 c5132_g1_i1:213-2162(+)